MRLPDLQRSYAVLIGTSTYHFSELADLPAVRNNLDGLAEILTDQALGWLPAERCVVLSDPTDVRAVYRTLRQYAAIAEDTLLVYFAGHGRTGPRNELYLGLTDTNPDELRVSALPFDLIREVLSDSPATNRVLILDCCFSGRAIQDMSGPDEAILGQIGIEGTYTLTSAPANAVALAPIGADYTAFTGELITLLRTGIPDGPELLTFATVYRQLLYTMTILGLPLPRQRGTGTVDQLALARNPARHPGQAPAPPSQRVGAFAQVHMDTTTSYHTWPRQTVPGGLHVQGARTSYVLGILIQLVTGSGFLIAGALPWFSNIFSAGFGGIDVASVVFEVLLFAMGLLLLALAASASRLVFNPPDLRIDSRGIELNVAGRRTSYRWKEISKVTVRPIRGSAAFAAGHAGIYLYPSPGAPPLQTIVALPFSKLEKDGWIFVATAQSFRVSPTELLTALAQFAGSRWNPEK